MRLIESFTASRPGKAVNEDAFVVTDCYAAVVDGAGDYRDRTYNGRTWGKIATDTLIETVKNLEPAADATQVFTQLHEALQSAHRVLPPDFQELPTPAASIVIFSKSKRQVWSVGSNTVTYNDPIDVSQTRYERLMIDIKCAMHEAMEGMNVPRETMLKDMSSVLKILHKYQPGIQNTSPERNFSFSVMDAVRPPSEISVIDIPLQFDELAMASDGYPQILCTLEKTEDFLRCIVESDPCLIGNYAQTKFPNSGAWDDRTYIRLDLS